MSTAAVTGIEEEYLSFFDGEVTLAFDKKLHAYYRIEGDQKILIPGVTSITGMVDKSGPLTQWAANMTVEYILNSFAVGEGVRSEIREAYEAAKAKQEFPQYEGVYKFERNLFARLLNEARFNFRNIKQEAADVGHVAHEWLERFIKWHIGCIELGAHIDDTKVHTPLIDCYKSGWSLSYSPWNAKTPLPENPQAANAVQAALDWLKLHEFTPVYSERRVYSREYDYAGTLDWLAWITLDGKRVLVLGDFKTSNALHDEYRMQLAAYHQCLHEEFPSLAKDITAHVLLRIGKDDGKFEVQVIPKSEFEYDLAGFLGAAQTYNWKKQLELNAKALKPKKGKKNKIVVPGEVISAIPTEAPKAV
jgi:hypothetical protein